jgi:hypothetical protein
MSQPPVVPMVNKDLSMSVWMNKPTHEIASAAEIHIRGSAASSQLDHQRIGVYRGAKRAGAAAETGPQDLKDNGHSLCVACRGIYKNLTCA